MKSKQLTIIMPICNGASTLDKVFKGLDSQQHKELVDKVIIIDDYSSDSSRSLISSYAKSSDFKVQVIKNAKSEGLAAGYNKGTLLTETAYMVTMHQDIVLTDNDSFVKMLIPFNNHKVTATYPIVLHPYEVWQTYNFWQKCLFSRFVGQKIPMLTGKFDCFKVEYLRKAGLFDSGTYRTAGEDSDIKLKINRDGLQFENSGVEVIHLQYVEKNFGLKKLIKKEAQLAEAQGTVLRRHGIQNPRNFVLNFFRQIMLIGLLVPRLNVVFGVVTLAYVIAYTHLVYQKEFRDPRVLTLPFVNFFLLFVALAASVRGFVQGRQVI